MEKSVLKAANYAVVREYYSVELVIRYETNSLSQLNESDSSQSYRRICPSLITASIGEYRGGARMAFVSQRINEPKNGCKTKKSIRAAK